jgi:hypothetical protein
MGSPNRQSVPYCPIGPCDWPIGGAIGQWLVLVNGWSQSKQIRDFSAEFPGFIGLETRAQILFAELWFAKPKYTEQQHPSQISNLFGNWPSGESRDTWLDALERVHNCHFKVLSLKLERHWHWISADGNSEEFTLGFFGSFFHWVTWRLDDSSEYVLRKLSKTSHIRHSGDGPSLFLVAALTYHENPTLKGLLDLGFSPNEEINLKCEVSEMDTVDTSPAIEKTTVWNAFCVCFASRMISWFMRVTHTPIYCKRLAVFLATRSVDADCFVLLAVEHYRREYKGEPTHVISLAELVQQLDPPNRNILSRLMKPSGLGVSTTLRDDRRYSLPSKSNQSFRLDKYLLFNLNMRPPTPDEPDSEESSEDSRDGLPYRFIVQSVRWRDTQLMAKLKIPIC